MTLRVSPPARGALLAILLPWAGAAPAAVEADAGPSRTAPVARRLGTNELAGGRPLAYRAPLSAYARAQVPRLGTNVPFVSAVLVLPPDWSERSSVPVLVVCSSSGAPAIPQLKGYTEAALAEGWAVLAADGPPLRADVDTVLWNAGTVGSALDYLHVALPESRAWPLALGGFSGGAKRAVCVAAALMQARRPVLGVFLGGCNEDRATTGALLFGPGPAYFSTPMFLSNGENDPIAGPGQAAVVQASMTRSAFKRTRLETYPGGHRLHAPHVREALRWFLEARR